MGPPLTKEELITRAARARELAVEAKFHRDGATRLLRVLLMRAGLESTAENASTIEACVESIVAAAGYEAEVRILGAANV